MKRTIGARYNFKNINTYANRGMTLEADIVIGWNASSIVKAIRENA